MTVQIFLGKFGFFIYFASLILVIIGTLDLLKLTNISKYLGQTPASTLLMAIGFLVTPVLVGLAKPTFPNLADFLNLIPIVFIFVATILARRGKNEKPHNKSLNTEASKAGSG